MGFITICHVVIAVLSVHLSTGIPSYQSQIPNGRNVDHPCRLNFKWQGVGHLNKAGGGENNQFGLDFKAAGYQWTRALCERDSDQDGKTNGEELGDPNCVWTIGTVPQRTTGITHPGICTPFGEGLCAGRDTYVSCEAEEGEVCNTESAPGIKSIDIRFPKTDVPFVETTYYCMTFDLPSDQDYQLVSYRPLIDNLNVMHHLLLFGCKSVSDDNKIDSPTTCTMEGNDCFDIIGLWQIGVDGDCYGDDGLAIRFGKSQFSRVRMELHWNNPELRSDYTDGSGIRLFYLPASAQYIDMAVVGFGQLSLTIPPGQDEVEESATCPGDCTPVIFAGPVNVRSAVSHMHYLGKKEKVELFRNGQKVTDIISDAVPYNYDNPEMVKFKTPLELRPGDEIKTTCTFTSLSRSTYTYWGEATNQEMCHAFLFVYPASSVTYSSCLSIGQMSACDHSYDPKPFDGCDARSFLDFKSEESIKRLERLKGNCNMFGFCRPECRDVADDVKSHPCLKGKSKDFVNFMLLTSGDGLNFLGNLHSCSSQSQDEPQQCPIRCETSGSYKTQNMIFIQICTFIMTMVYFLI